MDTLTRFATMVETAIDGGVRKLDAMDSPRFNRGVGFALAAPTIAVLATARMLAPAAEGFGTHTQLGLGSCTMLTLTGWPCPMCGMTTTFSHLAHFNVVDAALTQPFGLVLYALTVAGAVVGLADLVTGAGWWRRSLRSVQRFEEKGAIFLLLGMGLGWVYKCVRMHPEILAWIS